MFYIYDIFYTFDRDAFWRIIGITAGILYLGPLILGNEQMRYKL